MPTIIGGYDTNEQTDQVALRNPTIQRVGTRDFLDTFQAALTVALENNASGDPIYVGEAAPGVAKSEAGWRIRKLTYDGSGFLTDVQWAGGEFMFDKVWNDRAGYSYS